MVYTNTQMHTHAYIYDDLNVRLWLFDELEDIIIDSESNILCMKHGIYS